MKKSPVTWKLPQEAGNYWLTARLTGVAGRAVLSQRFVRAIPPPVVSEPLTSRKFVILGSDPAAEGFFKSRGLSASSDLGALAPGEHTVVVWDATRLTAEQRESNKVIDNFLRAGGKMLVLSASSWDWPELCDIKLAGQPRFSRVFPYAGSKHPLLEGLDPDWFIRWNGLHLKSHSERSHPAYDPVAERVLVNLLVGGSK